MLPAGAVAVGRMRRLIPPPLAAGFGVDLVTEPVNFTFCRAALPGRNHHPGTIARVDDMSGEEDRMRLFLDYEVGERVVGDEKHFLRRAFT